MNDAHLHGAQRPGPVQLRMLAVHGHVASRLSGKTVLDVGCGDGVGSRIYAEMAARVTGVDLEERPAWFSNLPSNVRFQEADARRLPFVAGGFEVVVGVEVLPAVLSPMRCLKEIFRAASEGVIISVPSLRYKAKHNVTPNWFNRWAFSLPELAAEMRHHSLRVKCFGTVRHAGPLWRFLGGVAYTVEPAARDEGQHETLILEGWK